MKEALGIAKPERNSMVTPATFFPPKQEVLPRRETCRSPDVSGSADHDEANSAAPKVFWDRRFAAAIGRRASSRPQPGVRKARRTPGIAMLTSNPRSLTMD